jgi:putative PIN family toxin of toxin-antitoxin system
VIRAVLDANVFVSGFPAHGVPVADLVDRWRAGAFQLVVSEHILDAIARAWAKPYWHARLSQQQVDRALAVLRAEAEIVELTVAVQGVASHPEDDFVLATALSGAVDYVITGDKRLQRLGSYEGVTIVDPRTFLTILDALG